MKVRLNVLPNGVPNGEPHAVLNGVVNGPSFRALSAERRLIPR